MLSINGNEVVFSNFFNLQEGSVGSFTIPRIPGVTFHFHVERKTFDQANVAGAFTFKAEGNHAHFSIPFFDGKSMNSGASFSVSQFAVVGSDEYTAQVTAQGVGSMMRLNIDVMLERK